MHPATRMTPSEGGVVLFKEDNSPAYNTTSCHVSFDHMLPALVKLAEALNNVQWLSRWEEYDKLYQ